MSRERSKYEWRVGTVVDGKWRLESLLGYGSSSAVYRAMHRNGNIAALKILHRHLSTDQAVVDRFLREGYIANSIKNAAVVPVRDDGLTEEGCAFLILELLEGETLEDRRERQGGRLTLDEFIPVMDTLMKTVSSIHATGWIHRDLKPSNVFVTNEGELKILDFGTARALAAPPEETHALVGSPAFMSPEVAKQDVSGVDARADVWSVGATIYTLLTGVLAHPEKDPELQMQAASTKRVRPIAEVSGWIDKRLATTIDRALAFDKAKRFPTLEAMRVEIVTAAATAAPTMRRFERDDSMRPPSPSVPELLPQMLIVPTPASFASMPVVVESRPSRTEMPRAKSHFGLVVGLGAGFAAILAVFLVMKASSDDPGAKRSAANAVIAPTEAARPIATIPPPARVDVERTSTPEPVAAPKFAKHRRRDAGVAVPTGVVDELDDDPPPPAAKPIVADSAGKKDLAQKLETPPPPKKSDVDIDLP